MTVWRGSPLVHRCVLSRVWLTFVVPGLSFLAFGAGTVNLGLLFIAYAGFIADHGWQALRDGALQQLVELVVTGYISMAAYVVFKTCEHRLSHWLGHQHEDGHWPLAPAPRRGGPGRLWISCYQNNSYLPRQYLG